MHKNQLIIYNEYKLLIYLTIVTMDIKKLVMVKDHKYLKI